MGKALYFLVLLGALGCNDSKFKQTNSPGAEPTKVVPGPIGGQQLPGGPVPCTTAGTTVVKLQTQSVRNKSPGQIIKYELSMNDCQGVQTPITATSILFDLNAIFTLSAPGAIAGSLPYTVTTMEGAPLGTGSLEVVPGQDLFGVSNPQHWHYRTNNPLNFPPATNRILLNVDISNTENHRPDTPTGGPFPPTELISSFLKFGNANPVEQPVTFQNQ